MPPRRLGSDVFASIIKLFRDCLTENDGASYCPFRVGGFALSGSAIPTFIGCTIWTTIRSGQFDAVTFGAAFISMMSGLAILAGGVALKARTDTPADGH